MKNRRQLIDSLRYADDQEVIDAIRAIPPHYSQITSTFGNLPGMGQVSETFESAYCWGPYPRYFTPGYIGSTSADPTNTPTWELRCGLVMGRQSATGTWVNYNPIATDGSEVAAGVLTIGLRMQDVLSGVNVPKFYAIMVSGGVQSAKLIGLDNMARQQMSKTFIFDDNLPGNVYFPFQRMQTKTANYAIQPADNMSHFDNAGAGGSVTFTLPPILNGYFFGFTAEVLAQNFIVTSNEGGNIIAFNTLTANTLTWSTGGAIGGGGGIFFTNPAGTKWIFRNWSAGANTITIS